jgi:hypothetical protein
VIGLPLSVVNAQSTLTVLASIVVVTDVGTTGIQAQSKVIVSVGVEYPYMFLA